VIFRNRTSVGAGILGTSLACLGMVAALSAQRGGGGGGGQPAGGGGFTIPTRLTLLTTAFKLEKDQVASVKGVIGAAAKDTTLRTELTSAYAAIGAAIQAGKGQDEIDKAVHAYADVSGKMTTLEMKTLADVLASLTPAQRENSAAVTSAVALMRGAFLDKKWDVAPGSKNY